MFRFFKKKEPKKIIQMANYLIYLEKNFYDRGRYIHWTVPKLQFALWLFDLNHRHSNGAFLFNDEMKRLGTHGVYYYEISKQFGQSPNISIYGESPESFHGLSIEEAKILEEFLEKNYNSLSNCMYSGKSLDKYMGGNTTSDYLNDSWMEDLYAKFIESS